MEKIKCSVSGKECNYENIRRGSYLRPQLLKLIQKDFPKFDEDSFISIDELNVYRKRYLSSLIDTDAGDISQLEKEVVDSINNNQILSENIEPDIDEGQTFGQKIADKIAAFGGSWPFIIIFFTFLLIWMGINVWLLETQPFDPYPFILLNLILSCLAAIQAPIIMMSQNRREQKDRIRSEHDYKVNLKAELEIKLLHEKVDHLMIYQNKRLLEIQELQTDYLEDILNLTKEHIAKK